MKQAMNPKAQAIHDAYQAYCDAFYRFVTNEEVAKLWEAYKQLQDQALEQHFGKDAE